MEFNIDFWCITKYPILSRKISLVCQVYISGVPSEDRPSYTHDIACGTNYRFTSSTQLPISFRSPLRILTQRVHVWYPIVLLKWDRSLDQGNWFWMTVHQRELGDVPLLHVVIDSLCKAKFYPWNTEINLDPLRLRQQSAKFSFIRANSFIFADQRKEKKHFL